MILIDGKKEAALLREDLKKEVSELKSRYNVVFTIGILNINYKYSIFTILIIRSLIYFISFHQCL